MSKELLDKWKELADNDLEAAKLLAQNKNLLLSAFHLQQCIEKYLKRYYIFSKQEQPPYINNLTQLAIYAELIDLMNQDQKDILDTLNPYYIKARYPTYKKQMADKLDDQIIGNLLSCVEDFILWLDQKIK